MLAKRLGIIFLLGKGLSHYQIGKSLRVSLSTVAHFGHLIDRGLYRQSLSWLETGGGENHVLDLLGFLLGPALGTRKSFAKFIEENI